jgi:hypothetical protein
MFTLELAQGNMETGDPRSQRGIAAVNRVGRLKHPGFRLD